MLEAADGGDWDAVARTIDAIQVCRRGLGRPHDARAGVTETLQRLGASAAAQQALEALPGADAAQADLLVAVLAAIGASSMPTIAERWAAERQQAVRTRLERVVAAAGKAGRDGLRRLLASDTEAAEVRVAAVRLLELTPGTDHLSALEAALSDPHDEVRAEAFRALTASASDRASEIIARGIVRADPATQVSLLSRLAAQGGARILPVLQRLTPQIDPQSAPVPVCLALVAVLGRAAGGEAESMLAGLIPRTHWRAPLRTWRIRAAANTALREVRRRGTASAAAGAAGTVRQLFRGRTMKDRAQRMQLYADIVQRMSGALRAASLYSIAHPSVGEHVRGLLEAVQRLHRVDASVLVGFIGGEVIADDTPLLAVTAYRTELIRYMQALGINRVLFDRGVTLEELTEFVRSVSQPSPAALRRAEAPEGADVDIDFLRLPHVRAGRIPVDTSEGKWGSSAVTLKQVYSGSIEAARMVWESTRTEGTPDAPAAHEAVEHLAEAVDSSRTTMIGLTGMKAHDEYTFTHMVNVSILTMAQARTLGIEGQALRALGLAAMLHDIGKVRTPLEVLNKPGTLTPDEREVMRRHPVDGAAILRATPDMPRLAAVVAFEHHLRADGTGYPNGVQRSPINLGTVLCSIADAYDAMRSTRVYQPATPADRIMEIMANNTGEQFDRHLVRRFIHLMGVYPPATLVRLSDASVGIVVESAGAAGLVVKLLFDPGGARLDVPLVRRLGPKQEPVAGSTTLTVEAPLDPSLYDLDPGDYL